MLSLFAEYCCSVMILTMIYMEVSNLSAPTRSNDLYVYGIQTVFSKSIEVGSAALYLPVFNLAYSALTL